MLFQVGKGSGLKIVPGCPLVRGKSLRRESSSSLLPGLTGRTINSEDRSSGSLGNSPHLCFPLCLTQHNVHAMTAPRSQSSDTHFLHELQQLPVYLPPMPPWSGGETLPGL